MGSLGIRPGVGAAVPGLRIEFAVAIGDATLMVFCGGSEYVVSSEYPLCIGGC
jgi:hypothetical protein